MNGDDTASQYPRRSSTDGATDSAPTTADAIDYDTMGGGSQTGKRWFMVQYIANKSDQEKLVQYNMVYNRAGLTQSYAPTRIEGVGKWVNASDSINRLNLNSMNTGTITSDSEVVVLGWDPTDTHTDNFWEELSSKELDSTENELSSGTITAKKYLWVQYYVKKTGTANTRWRFNSDDTTLYSHRYSGNGATDGTPLTSQTSIYTHANTNSNAFGNIFIINNSGSEKLGMFHETTTSNDRSEVAGKWNNTSEQITEINLINTDTGGFTSGTIMKVWGSN
jgi:hypothetical protein